MNSWLSQHKDATHLEISPRTYDKWYTLEQKDFDQLHEFSNLQSLIIDHALALSNLNFVGTLPHLTSLQVTCCTSLSDITGLSSLKMVRSLNLSSSGEVTITDFEPLSHMTALRTLSLNNMKKLLSLEWMRPLVLLERLDLNFCSNLSDIQALEFLPCLKLLSTEGCSACHHLLPSVYQKINIRQNFISH